MSQYNTYYMNKQRYIHLKNNLTGGTKKTYAILHSTSYENLIDILKCGVLYANAYIDDKHKRLSGDENMEYIFTNMVRSDIKIPDFGFGLLFNTNILNDKTFYFNKYWVAGINDGTIKVTKQNRKGLIRNIIKYINEKNDNIGHEVTGHEILFKKSIDVKKYLIGINCQVGTTEENQNLLDILRDFGYKKTKMYS